MQAVLRGIIKVLVNPICTDDTKEPKNLHFTICFLFSEQKLKRSSVIHLIYAKKILMHTNSFKKMIKRR